MLNLKAWMTKVTQWFASGSTADIYSDADAPCLCDGLFRNAGKRRDYLPFRLDLSGVRYDSAGPDVEG